MWEKKIKMNTARVESLIQIDWHFFLECNVIIAKISQKYFLHAISPPQLNCGRHTFCKKLNNLLVQSHEVESSGGKGKKVPGKFIRKHSFSAQFFFLGTTTAVLKGGNVDNEWVWMSENQRLKTANSMENKFVMMGVRKCFPLFQFSFIPFDFPPTSFWWKWIENAKEITQKVLKNEGKFQNNELIEVIFMIGKENVLKRKFLASESCGKFWKLETFLFSWKIFFCNFHWVETNWELFHYCCRE